MYKSYDFPVSEGTTNEIKTQFFVEINLFMIDLGEGKMYSAALHKNPTQTVDSSQVFKR